MRDGKHKLDDHTSSRWRALPEDANHDGVAGIEGVDGVAADRRDNGGDDDGKTHLQKHGNTGAKLSAHDRPSSKVAPQA